MTNHYHILGLIFEQRLNWEEHIKDVKARAMTKLNIIKSLAHKKWGADQQTLLRIHQMIILPKLTYEYAAYGSASPTTLKTLDPVHHKEVGLALRTFAVCRTENCLIEAKIREKDTARIAIRVITNISHRLLYEQQDP
jgi:hypothetical protein